MSPPELERFVDGAVRGAMASDHVAGVSVAVVQDGEVVLLKGYGMAAPGRAVDPRRDLFRIASVSKTFTWIALMRAVEEGRIRLDAPVNDYLPPKLRIPDQGFAAPIRVVDLMSHSAGFEDSVLGHLLADRPEKVTPMADYLVAHRPRRVREPGVLATYSNYGAALAGYITARAEGVDYQTLLERDLFSPLGMSGTTFREPYPARPDLPAPMSPDQARRLATGFQWQEGRFQPRGFEYLTQDAPIGGASATAADMARYMLMQLNGGTLDGVRIYGPATAQAFRTPILRVPEGVNGWAHGLRVGVLPGGVRTYSHNGALQWFFSSLTLAPDLKLGVFVNTNTSTGANLTERLPKQIIAHFYGPKSPAPRRPGDPGLAGRGDVYVGRYITTRRSYTGLEKFVDLLEADDQVSVTSDGYLVTKIGGETRSWVPDGAPGRFVSAEGSDPLVFKLDAGGRATSFPALRGGNSEVRAPMLLDNGLFRLSGALALAGALATLIAGACSLGDRALRADRQARAHLLGLGVAALWLLAFAAFWCSGLPSGKASALAYDFPGPMLLAASWAALLATVASITLLGAAILAWPAPANGEGWSLWRKAGQGLAIVSFLLFALVLGARGGLTPWI